MFIFFLENVQVSKEATPTGPDLQLTGHQINKYF